jgi:hypothetical protein
MRLRFNRETGQAEEVPQAPLESEVALHVAKDKRFAVHSVEPWTPGFEHYEKDGTPFVTCQREIDNALRANPGSSYGGDREPYSSYHRG